jgi:hypothetical protein
MATANLNVSINFYSTNLYALFGTTEKGKKTTKQAHQKKA